MKSTSSVAFIGISLFLASLLMLANAYSSPKKQNDSQENYSVGQTVSTPNVAQKNLQLSEFKPTSLNSHVSDVSLPVHVEIIAKKLIPITPSKKYILDIAQIIAAFASLGALLFLLWQNILLQRQSKELSQSVRSATYQNIVNHYVDINKTLAIDSGIADAYDSFENESKNSSPEKERKREWLAWWLLNHYENAYMQFQLGVLPKFMWNGIENDCLAQIKKPYVSNLWGDSKQLFSEEFRGFIEKHAYDQKIISDKNLNAKPTSSPLQHD